MEPRLALFLGLLRVFLAYFTNAFELLSARVEVSTPFSSFTKLQECAFLYSKSINPYDGGVCHQAPLLIPLLNVLPRAMIPFCFILLDLYISLTLVQLGSYKLRLQKSEIWPKPTLLNQKQAGSPDALSFETEEDVYKDKTLPERVWIEPKWIGLMYLLNPYTILSCAARSPSTITNAAVVTGILFATRGKMQGSMIWLAVASYLGLYPIAFLPPCLVLLTTSHSNIYRTTFKGVVSFSFYLGFLLYLSFQFLGSWQFLESTYGIQLSVADLTPNIGLFWYFFVEVFESFRTFFVCLFQFLVFIFVVPITIRFRNHPLFSIYLIASVLAILKAYPSISDTSLSIALLSLHPEVLKYATNAFIITNVVLYASTLGPLFLNLWLYASSGNSNFFYAITLLWGLSHVMLMMEMGSAFVTREWERTHPGWRIAKVESVMK